ncbi:hypothetical protein RL74_01250 [Pseudomonas fluorescens]|uniref:SMEK domain-containing protein n=2 Tax=Pseudomonas fluorescens TaxID=294 RepID=A0A0D0PFW2_PSEFL|nr:hypothetical protein RL74_01250 [Pseudomonas fluorescens]
MNSVIERLSWIKAQVTLYNRINLTDINVHSENFYKDLLNLALGYNLININIDDQNAAAIDLGDETQKIAIQVTSTSDLKKARKTVTKFVENKLNLKYDQLKIFNITTKKKHKEKEVCFEAWRLDTDKDIWDVDWLVAKISELSLEKLNQISIFLEREVTINVTTSISKEVGTIIRLIEYMSDDEHPEAGNGYLEEPFPDKKINKRFADHSVYLKARFTELYIEYGGVLHTVKDSSDIGQVKLRRAGNYLRGLSDKILTDCSGNPKAALEKLVTNFSEILGRNQVDYDHDAAEFYIIDQLIQCNVFPNRDILCLA